MFFDKTIYSALCCTRTRATTSPTYLCPADGPPYRSARVPPLIAPTSAHVTAGSKIRIPLATVMSAAPSLRLQDDPKQTQTAPRASSDITVAQRMLSACLGSIVTSLILTPFDVVRIRIQQQEILPSNPCCAQHFPQQYASQALSPKAEPFWIQRHYCETAEACTRVTSTFQGFQMIRNNEGIATLWRGLSLTLLIAVPANIIYFTGYEYIRDHSPIASTTLNPLLCGSLARLMAATSVAPVELVKTRLQAIPHDANNSKILTKLVADLVAEVRQRGTGALFTGLQITLWRDVPFSGIYWLCYESFKSRFLSLLQDFSPHLPRTADWKVFTTSFLSGSAAGLIAAVATHPFDVGKTRLQITGEYKERENGLKKASRKLPMFSYLYNIGKNEGVSALYSGLGPRALKIAPSCAIMISSYEITKHFFLHL